MLFSTASDFPITEQSCTTACPTLEHEGDFYLKKYKIAD